MLIKHISCGLQNDQPKQETGKGHSRVFNTKAYATETNRCPVKTFKTFVSHRPKNMCKAESPFFLAVRLNVDLSLEEWYFDKPLGKYGIGNNNMPYQLQQQMMEPWNPV